MLFGPKTARYGRLWPKRGIVPNDNDRVEVPDFRRKNMRFMSYLECDLQ